MYPTVGWRPSSDRGDRLSFVFIEKENRAQMIHKNNPCFLNIQSSHNQLMRMMFFWANTHFFGVKHNRSLHYYVYKVGPYDRCKSSYNPYKGPYKWVTGVITLLIGPGLELHL